MWAEAPVQLPQQHWEGVGKRLQAFVLLPVISFVSEVPGRGWKQGEVFCVSASPGAQPFLEQIENSAEALQDYGISVVKVHEHEEWDKLFLEIISPLPFHPLP